MIRICPNPQPWNSVYEEVIRFTTEHSCSPAEPPKPLILAGWAYSSDRAKAARWKETVEWATQNGCAKFVTEIPDSDFYFVNETR